MDAETKPKRPRGGRQGISLEDMKILRQSWKTRHGDPEKVRGLKGRFEEFTRRLEVCYMAGLGGFDLDAIAKEKKVSRATAARYLQRYRAGGVAALVRKPMGGLMRHNHLLFPPEIEQQLRTKLRQEHGLSAKLLLAWLGLRSVVLSTQQLYGWLRRQGLRLRPRHGRKHRRRGRHLELLGPAQAPVP